MVKKYILALFLFCVIVVAGFYVGINQKYNVGYVKQVYNSNLEKSKYVIKEIIEESDYYSIKVYYPETKYKDFNNKIKKSIDTKLEEFKGNINVINKDEIDYKFNFDITFNSYECNNYISIVLDTTFYTGGAHPDEIIEAFNYDIKNNKIITIDDLININPEIISTFSESTYKLLSNEERIQKYSDDKFLVAGTSKNKENFNNFAFYKDGLIIFFNKYQVAPYVAGSFEVKLPYEILNLDI